MGPKPITHERPDAAIAHTFIGGSEAFELLSQPTYGRGCERALAYRKKETLPDFPEVVDAKRLGLFRRGHRLEAVAASMYTEQTGRVLVRKRGLRRHPDHRGAGVHTDRIILTVDDRGTGDAEIKTHGEGPFLNIMKNGLPPAHNLQLQYSLWITGHKWGVFIILGVFEDLPLKHFEVEADPEIQRIFSRKVDEFWHGLSLNRLPAQLPDENDQRCKLCPWRLTCRGSQLDPDELLRVMHERTRPLKIVNSEELDQALYDYALIRSEINALNNESEEDPGALQLVSRRIKELVGEDEALLVNSRWKVYSSDSIWSGIDSKRLKVEEPAIYERFYVRGRHTGGKRLSVYAVGERQ